MTKNQKTILGRIKQVFLDILANDKSPLVVAGLILVFILGPIYWVLAQAFKTYGEVMRWPPTLFPVNPTIGTFKEVLIQSPIPMYLMNSIIYALAVTSFVLVFSSLAAYGLSKFKYRGSGRVSTGFFLTRVIPPIAMLLPFYLIFKQIGVMDTRFAVIIYSSYITFPLCVWLLKSFFDQFPTALIESAKVDGCSKIGTLRRVVIPVSTPGLASVACISFMWTWNEFIAAYLFINSESIKPITVGIYYFLGDELLMWHQLSAAAFLAAIPGMIFFFIAQKYIVSGLTAGALKGTV